MIFIVLCNFYTKVCMEGNIIKKFRQINSIQKQNDLPFSCTSNVNKNKKIRHKIIIVRKRYNNFIFIVSCDNPCQIDQRDAIFLK